MIKLIMFGLFTVAFVILIFKGFKKLESIKTKKDIKYRQNDNLLAKYYSEMINERNDGWTQLHYKNLYNQRLKILKEKI